VFVHRNFPHIPELIALNPGNRNWASGVLGFREADYALAMRALSRLANCAKLHAFDGLRDDTMSMDDQLPQEETYAPEQSRGPTQKRGYFFYIAVFFILIALLCYMLSTVIWSQLDLTAPTSPTNSTTPK
jgi:hypothetical protein